MDHQASTPLDHRVRDAMLPWLDGRAANPSSPHALGRAARAAIEAARADVAALIDADPSEIVFTSGATESNHLAILGVARANARPIRVISSRIEHKAILEPLRVLEREGHSVALERPGRGGVLSPDIDPGAADLVSFMLVNNELGTVQPIAELARRARAAGALVHTDAAQGLGRVPISVEELPLDLVSISGHKMYGPVGVGALYVRSGVGRRLAPLLVGGGQEGGLRAGTPNVAAIVGLGRAARIAREEQRGDEERIRALRDQLRERLESAGPVEDNAPADARIAGSLPLCFPGVDAVKLVERLADEVALSAGSACTTDALEPSHVLRAVGLGNDRARASVRICLGRFTTEDDVDRAAEAIARAAKELRA
jgi:cysteine desulfurase